MEALAHRIACIATAPQHGHDIITHDINGYLIKPQNTQALSHALAELYINTHDRDRYAAQGHNLVITELSHSRMIEQYQELYEKVLRNTTFQESDY